MCVCVCVFVQDDKHKLRAIREKAQLKVQEKLASDSKAKAIKTQEERKYALETMMRVSHLHHFLYHILCYSI